MADYITKIKTKDGDKQIDYNSLANKPQSDTTLNQSGKFADAKAVGDSLAKKLDSPTSAGTTGQVLTKTATGQQWQTPAASSEDVEQIETNKGNITTLQGKVNTLESEMDTAQADITELESNVGTLTSKMSTAESDIDNLQSAQSTMNTTLQGKLDATGVDNKIKEVAPFVDASFDTSGEDTNKLVLSKYGGGTKEVLIPKDKYIQSASLGENNVLTLTFTDNSTVTVDLSDLITPIDNTLTQEGQAADAKAVGEKIKESAISDEYSGASEYICEPTVNAPVVVKELDGKTEQGENPTPDNPQVIKGVGGMGYFDGEWRQGSYNISGVPNTSGAWISFVNKIPCKANDNIKVSYDKDIVGIRIFFWNTSGGFLSSEPIDGKETTGWTAPATAGSFVISFNDNNISPALAAYCTVAINGEYQTGVEVHGAQLFDASKLPTTSAHGATVTNNGDGSFTISGSGNVSSLFVNSYSYTHEEALKLLKSGNIQLNVDKGTTNPYVYVQIRNKASSYIELNSTSSGSLNGNIESAILENEDTYLSIGIAAQNGSAIVPGTIKPMLYQSGDGTWQPYHHTALTIPLTAPLYEGDKICYVKPGESYVDAEGETVVADGILYGVYRENATVVFDGSEDETWEEYVAEGNPNGKTYLIRNFVNSKDQRTTCVTNRFLPYDSGWAGLPLNRCQNKDNAFGCCVDTSISTTSVFKTWLQTHNVTVVVKLLQPYFEPFSDQSIFYNLRTDDTLSYVYSSDPIEPNVTVEVAKNETGGILLESYTALAQLIGETVIIE